MHIPSTYRQNTISLLMSPSWKLTQMNVTAVQCAPDQLIADAMMTIAAGSPLPATRQGSMLHYHAASDPIVPGDKSSRLRAVEIQDAFLYTLCEAQKHGATSVMVDFENSFTRHGHHTN